jgi:hypothetical protein
VHVGARMPTDYVSMRTRVPVRDAVLRNQPRCVVTSNKKDVRERRSDAND